MHSLQVDERHLQAFFWSIWDLINFVNLSVRFKRATRLELDCAKPYLEVLILKQPWQTAWPERISYGLSDAADNLVFQMMTTYLLFFYTDV